MWNGSPLNLGGWHRLAIVALVLWWLYCAGRAYRGYVVMRGPDSPFSFAVERGRDQMWGALLGAFLVPGGILLAFVVVRWVIAGFRKP